MNGADIIAQLFEPFLESMIIQLEREGEVISEAWSIDMVGHGDSSRQPDGSHSWLSTYSLFKRDHQLIGCFFHSQYMRRSARRHYIFDSLSCSRPLCGRLAIAACTHQLRAMVTRRDDAHQEAPSWLRTFFGRPGPAQCCPSPSRRL